MPSMKPLNRLEALAQGLIEGAFNHIFQTGSRDVKPKIDTKEVLSVPSDQTAKYWLLQLETRQLRLG